MLHCSVTRRPATAAEVAAAIASIDGAPGIYFGCDAGIAGLHPMRAILLAEPALALRVFADGVTATALDAFGDALLRHAAMAAFVAAAGRGAARSPLAALRAFLQVWNGADEVCLVGAVGFDAHRLAAPAPRLAAQSVSTRGGPVALGVFYFATTLLRRDAAGLWTRIELAFADAALAEARSIGVLPIAASRADAADRSSPISSPVAADDFAPGGYATIVARAVQRLAATPLVSLTLSQSFRRTVAAGTVAPAFESLCAANPAPATFFFNAGDGERVFGASPDLQLRLQGRRIEAFPVCGTVARGPGPLGEAESLRRLINEAVDAASLAVCSDALRNDLAPLCVPGSLRLLDRRRPMSLATVVHTVDRLAGELRDGVDAWDAIVATAAPVMATGTPRRLALDAIAELEAGRRGWYGGLVVEVGADGDALVGTILRAAAVRDGIAEVRTGGDLLADSEPAREEQESRVKAVSLWRALGLAVADDLRSGIAGDREPARPIGRGTASVALCDGGDLFAAALEDTLRGLGVQINAASTTRLLIGAGDARGVVEAARDGGLVAIGDGAACVLRHAGFTVRSIRPEHGRPVRCLPVEAAPWQAERAFFAARYATLEVDWARPLEAASAGRWTAWLRDDEGRPLILACSEQRIVCLLIRPESLLSEEPARDALRAAIAFAANAVGAGRA